MKAVGFPQANKTLTALPGQEAEVYDLPVWSDGNRCISCWQPTDEERAAIASGAPIWLWVIGSTHPPVAVEALNPFQSSFDPTESIEVETPTQDEVDYVVRKMVNP